MVGQTINHYKITKKIGEGGMGAVYQATDTRLGREVALKILPEKFVQDRQRMGRFQREAEVLASLNHPHISTIHGLEEQGEVRALVLELVEGPTLGERIAEGPIPVDEALPMAREMTQALEAAHEKGIIHRDLKPANVKITPEGAVKVLDFGLAKAMEGELSRRELANSPTLTLEATQEGIILGTVAYMSPEQARGQAVDKRSDIWAFGLVFFEMLTGKGMYTGRSLTETLAAVIHEEPNLDALPQDTPLRIRDLLERCLRKDPQLRIRDMGEARITIHEAITQPDEPEAAERPRETPLWARLLPVAVAVVLAAVVYFWPHPPDDAEKKIARFEIPAAEAEVLDHQFRRGVDLSPDGKQLAFVAAPPGDASKRKVYVHSLERGQTTPLRDAGNATLPFFSHDGEWLGVWSSTDRKLKKYPLAGGTPTTICDAELPFGASWASDDTIVFAPDQESALWRVSASGGEPAALTELDRAAGEVSHRLPHVLPGAEAVLFTVMRFQTDTTGWSKSQIAVQSLGGQEKRILIEGGSDARYVPTGNLTGHLVYALEGTLMAAPFDLQKLELSGPIVPVQENVSHAIYSGVSGQETGAGQFAFSNSGTLAYISGSLFPEAKRQLVWVDRKGVEEPINLEPAKYVSVRLSPDGDRLLLDTLYKSSSIWTFDLVRGARAPQTFEGDNMWPIWSADGSRVTFASEREGQRMLFWKPVDSGGGAERLASGDRPQVPGSWSPNGERLAFVQLDAAAGGDIWTVSKEGSDSSEAFLEARFDQSQPEFSPDGRWLAYVSTDSGGHQVYLQAYPGPGGKQQISTRGGFSPAWSASSRELFYRYERKLWAVKIGEDGSPGSPEPLFGGPYLSNVQFRSYDVHPDGQRFLMIREDEAEIDRTLQAAYYGNKVRIVLNWFEELKQLVSTTGS